MFNTYERVITTTQDIEDRLTILFRLPTSLQLIDELDSLRGRVPKHILDHLHRIRKHRNYIAHNQIYAF